MAAEQQQQQQQQHINKRKLASLRLVEAVTRLPDSERIELAMVDSWPVVVPKGKFQKGDVCVYFEIDAFLPVEPHFEFLRKSCFSHHPWMGPGFLIKTCWIRDVLSQGLVLRLDDFPLEVQLSLNDLLAEKKSLENGDHIDVSALLGVRKYETENALGETLADIRKKIVRQQSPSKIPNNTNQQLSFASFPDFIPKTDQERLQNCFRKIAVTYSSPSTTDTVHHKKGDDETTKEADDEAVIPVAGAGIPFEVTLKLDGSSMTVYLHEGHVGVCSRNNEIKETALDNQSLKFWRITKQLGLAERLTELGQSVAIQGELMGPKINKNREEFDSLRFFVFDIYDIEKRSFLTASKRQSLLEQLNSIRPLDFPPILHVPVIEPQRVFDFPTINEAMDYVKSIKSIHHPICEGVVFKNTLFPWVSFKIINNKYLEAK